jgi:hypothetical protein
MPEDLLANHGLCTVDLDLKKLKTLINARTERPDNTANFHPRIIFSNDELLLLGTGLQYNLNHQHKKWFRTLAL